MDFMVLSVFSSHEANYNLIFNSKVLSDRIKEWIKGPIRDSKGISKLPEYS